MTDTPSTPPADMETKSTAGGIGSGLAEDGKPGYKIEGQPAPEHGDDGIQYGYSNSPGNTGDDGTSSIFTERNKSADSGSSSGSKASARKAPAKAADSK
jgi:hypothetical protein